MNKILQIEELQYIIFSKVYSKFKIIKKQISLDGQKDAYFIVENNIFQNNSADDNGVCIFLSNLNSSGQIFLLNNSFISNEISFQTNSLGSIIYLENPSTISIENYTFFNNSGIIGTCIYYLESNNVYSFILQGNIFDNNKALITGGGIYFAQIDENINNDILSYNNFLNNQAYYDNETNDISSPPFRMKLNESLTNQIVVIPGITSLNFSLKILDFYNQTIMNLTFGSYCIVRLKNYPIFSDIEINSTISLDGFSTENVLNGFYSYKLFLKIIFIKCIF